MNPFVQPFDFGVLNFGISAKSLSKKLRISEQAISDVLVGAGFRNFGLPFHNLKEEHLQIVCKSYADGVVDYFQRTVKSYHELSIEEQENLRIFFARFIKGGFSLTSEELFKAKIDKSLVRKFFFQIVADIEYSEYFGDFARIKFVENISNEEEERIFNKFSRNIRLRCHRTYNDIKSQLYSIIISNHYYIFPDDEDHLAEASISSLSSVNRITDDTLNGLIHLKFLSSWKKIVINTHTLSIA